MTRLFLSLSSVLILISLTSSGAFAGGASAEAEFQRIKKLWFGKADNAIKKKVVEIAELIRAAEIDADSFNRVIRRSTAMIERDLAETENFILFLNKKFKDGNRSDRKTANKILTGLVKNLEALEQYQGKKIPANPTGLAQWVAEQVSRAAGLPLSRTVSQKTDCGLALKQGASTSQHYDIEGQPIVTEHYLYEY